MKIFRKMISTIVSVCMLTYAMPGFAFSSAATDVSVSKVELTVEQMADTFGAGGIDATVNDYTIAGGVASGTVTNRAVIPFPYQLIVTDLNGISSTVIASGVVQQGTSVFVSAPAALAQGNVVELNATHNSLPGFRSIDTYGVLF